MSPRAAPVLDADLEAGLRRLKLAAIRRMAPEVLQAAKVQRWAPDELLRTLVEAEIAARDASNETTRRKAAGFPVSRRLEDLVLAESSLPRATFEHLASLDWIEAAENVVLVGPAGTGKSHILLGLGEAAVVSGRRVRYLPAASLVETLYGGLADNSVGRVIERLLRHDLVIIDDLGFAPLDDVGSQLLFRFVAAAYEHRSLGVASHWPFESWGRFLPEHATAVALLDRLLHHATTVVTSGDSYRMKEARQRGGGLPTA
jgi:DNA replication protein DnaC